MSSPSNDRLRQFMLGTLPRDQAEEVARWVAEDLNAARRLQDLEASDVLTAALTRGDTTMPPAEAIDRVISAALHNTPQANDADASTVWPEASAPATTPPERVGPYRVLRELGRGGMGVVYEAHDEVLGRPVALKVIAAGVDSPAARQRFLREARAAAALDHEGIVPVYAAGEEGGRHYLAMPLLAGETLAARLSRGPLPPDQACVVVRQVAEALAAAHAAGLVHRDVKPSNIWLEHGASGEFRRARVLDFGLVRTTTASDPALTQSGAVLGTPAYVAPEQARARPVDHRADLYSLGAVLYHVTTGRVPFEGPDAFSILTALAVDEAVPPATRNPRVPTELSALTMRLLAKDPAQRPASATEVAAALKRLETAPVRRPGRRWAVAVGLASVAALLLAGVVIIIQHQNGKRTRIEVPDGSTVKVGKNGEVEVTPPGEKEKPKEKEPKDKAEPKDKEDAKQQARRKAIEWVIRTHHTHRCEYAVRSSKGIVYPSKVEDIPDDGSLVRLVLRNNPKVTDAEIRTHLKGADGLEHVDLEGCANVSDEGVAVLAGLPSLQHLNLDKTSITDAGLTALADARGLTLLVISGTKVSSVGLEELRRTRLTELLIDNFPLNDDSLKAISQIKTLEGLTARDTRAPGKLTGVGIAHLANLPKLKGLDINNTVLDADGAAAIGKLTALVRLYANNTSCDDRALANWTQLRSLEKLMLHGTAVRGPGLAHLAKLPKLSELRLCKCTISDEGFAHLAKSDSITGLALEKTPLSDDAAWSLAGMKSLSVLDAPSSGVSDQGLKNLSSSESLEHLDVSGAKITDVGVKHLSTMKGLRGLTLRDTGVSDLSYPVLREMKSLTGIDLTGSRVTPTGLGALRKRLPKCNVKPGTPAPVHLTAGDRKALAWAVERGAEVGVAHYNDFGRGFALKKSNLQEIDEYLWADWLRPVQIIIWPRTPGVDSRSIEALSTLSSLNTLVVSSCPLDEGMGKLAAAPFAKTLIGLELIDVGLTDEGATHLAAFENLNSLNVANNRLTAAGMAHVAKLSKLRKLDTSGNPDLTDDAIARLKRLPLTELHLWCERLTDRTAEHLSALDQLQTLGLSGDGTPDEAIAKMLKSLPALRTLGLGRKTTGKLLSQLAECNRLEDLYLQETHKTTDEDLKALRLSPSVTTIYLRSSTFTDAGLRHLERFGHLRRLYLETRHDKISAKAVEALSKTLPKTLIRCPHGDFLAGKKQ